ncbi:hypothetical protein [Lysobacter sp. F6437]|uniref:hypothetical protein n=1 Tax=Lysobacter sp. F6437 TaxID=3459296 RepID=UPI00403DD499
MTRSSKLMVLTAVLALAPYAAHACSCPPPPPAKEAAKRSDRVFLGKVTSVQTHQPSDFVLWIEGRIAELGEVLGRDWRRDYRYVFRREVTLEVMENFKGGAVNELMITTGLGGGDCGVFFTTGQAYLVFAKHLNDRNMLVTGICDGTDEARRLQPQLAQLRSGI